MDGRKRRKSNSHYAAFRGRRGRRGGPKVDEARGEISGGGFGKRRRREGGEGGKEREVAWKDG